MHYATHQKEPHQPVCFMELQSFSCNGPSYNEFHWSRRISVNLWQLLSKHDWSKSSEIHKKGALLVISLEQAPVQLILDCLPWNWLAKIHKAVWILGNLWILSNFDNCFIFQNTFIKKYIKGGIPPKIIKTHPSLLLLKDSTCIWTISEA